jgi:mannose-6-phosphate isomerase-like protein (cupin superfamily)
MLFHTEESREYHIEEDCHIIEIMNYADHPELSIARARVLPSVKTRAHSLIDTTEYYQILSGQGTAFIGDDVFSVKKGDLIKIEPETPQSIQNTGETDLIFLCICQPRFLPSNYKNLE